MSYAVFRLAGSGLAAALLLIPTISFAQSQGLTSTVQACRASNLENTACTVNHVDEGARILSVGTAENNFSTGVGETGVASILVRNRAAFGDLGLALEGNLQVVIGVNGFGASAFSGADVSFFDTLRVTSASLPAGTPVSIRFSGNLTGSETTTSLLAPGFNQSIQRNLIASLRVNSQDLYNVGYGTVAGAPGVTEINSPNYSFTALLDSTVGADLTVYGTLSSFISIGISALGVGAAPPISGSLNYGLLAFDSAHTFADVITPDVSLISLSGVSYVTPVPETGALPLMALGFLTLLVRRSRRSGVSVR